MEIFHTGESNRRIVSIFYPGNEQKTKKTGVVICNPLGHEHTRFYKSISVLAKELSAQGFPTMRFDYYGTGDSYGEETEIDVESTKCDLEMVVQELLDGCNVDNICLIGIRYGSLPALVSLHKLKVNSLILWNPVCTGKHYLQEMQAGEQSFYQGSFAVKKNHDHEYFGFTYNPTFIQQLQKFETSSLKPGPLYKLLLVADNDHIPAISENLQNLFPDTNPDIIENTVSKFWLKQKGEEDKAMVPITEIKKISEWVQMLK